MKIRILDSLLITAIVISGACTSQQSLPSSNSAETDPRELATADSTPSTVEPMVYRASATRLMDLLHTRLEVHFNWELQQLYGQARLHLKPYFYPQHQLVLDAKGFEIHQVFLLRELQEAPLNYFYDGNKLYIDLDRVYTREQDFFIQINYTAKPTDRNIGGSEAITSDQGLYFINHDGTDPDKPRQIWTQGETQSSSCWFPTIDAPNERATQEIFITIDEQYVTLSNGILVYSRNNGDGTRTDYWKMDLPHAPYLHMMAAGEFSVIRDQWEDIPLYYYLEKEFEPYAHDIFGRTPEMMTFFSGITGVKYPWSKYAQVVVRDYVSGAMENTTATVFYDDLLMNRRELIDYNQDNIIAHELFHHWFGDLVTCESWANLPLNESFANYSEYLWNEYKYGVDEADLHALGEREQYFAESEKKQVDLIRFYYEDQEDMFDSHSYAKGGLILHMLRKQIGDEAFFKSLNLYLERHKFTSVEVHDLRLVFEEVTGEDLNWYFNQWFLASGHPVIRVSHVFEDQKLKLKVEQRQDLSTTPLYILPLEVEIYHNDTLEKFHIVIDQVEQVYEFNMNRKPDLVIFDAEHQLLAEIEQEKEPEEYRFQYAHTSRFLPRYEALEFLSGQVADSSVRRVLFQAMSDKFWYFRQMAVNAFEEYEGPDKNVVVENLVRLITSDPNSLVRADAINTLFSLEGNRYSEIYKKSLLDSSYSVVGSALYAYMQSEAGDMTWVVKQLESENNLYIVIPLASYFVDHKQYDRYSWFTGKMQKMTWEGLWYMLQYFGEFLMEAPELDQRRGIAELERYARHHSQMYVRLAAYQGLGLLTDLSGVEELRKDIRENETSTYLKNIFDSFP